MATQPRMLRRTPTDESGLFLMEPAAPRDGSYPSPSNEHLNFPLSSLVFNPSDAIAVSGQNIRQFLVPFERDGTGASAGLARRPHWDYPRLPCHLGVGFAIRGIGLAAHRCAHVATARSSND